MAVVVAVRLQAIALQLPFSNLLLAAACSKSTTRVIYTRTWIDVATRSMDQILPF